MSASWRPAVACFGTGAPPRAATSDHRCSHHIHRSRGKRLSGASGHSRSSGSNRRSSSDHSFIGKPPMLREVKNLRRDGTGRRQRHRPRLLSTCVGLGVARVGRYRSRPALSMASRMTAAVTPTGDTLAQRLRPPPGLVPAAGLCHPRSRIRTGGRLRSPRRRYRQRPHRPARPSPSSTGVEPALGSPSSPETAGARAAALEDHLARPECDRVALAAWSFHSRQSSSASTSTCEPLPRYCAQLRAAACLLPAVPA